MRTAPPTLSRNAQINLVPAQSHIVCCPTAFRPDFRRRLPDQEWRSSRVRRRLLRRLKVFQVSGPHGTTAPSAKPPPLARSRTQPPLPPSPPLRFCAVDATQWQCLPPGEFDSPPGGREGSARSSWEHLAGGPEPTAGTGVQPGRGGCVLAPLSPLPPPEPARHSPAPSCPPHGTAAPPSHAPAGVPSPPCTPQTAPISLAPPPSPSPCPTRRRRNSDFCVPARPCRASAQKSELRRRRFGHMLELVGRAMRIGAVRRVSGRLAKSAGVWLGRVAASVG